MIWNGYGSKGLGNIYLEGESDESKFSLFWHPHPERAPDTPAARRLRDRRAVPDLRCPWQERDEGMSNGTENWVLSFG